MAIEYGDWPTKPGQPNKVTEHSQKLYEALRNELDVLDGKPRGRRRPLTVVKNDGRIACCLLVHGKKMPLDDAGHLAVMLLPLHGACLSVAPFGSSLL